MKRNGGAGTREEAKSSTSIITSFPPLSRAEHQIFLEMANLSRAGFFQLFLGHDRVAGRIFARESHHFGRFHGQPARPGSQKVGCVLRIRNQAIRPSAPGPIPRGEDLIVGRLSQFAVRQAEELIGLLEIAAAQALAEPVDPLLGRAVRELFRHDVALGLLLQPVIANGLGGSDRLLDVARFQNVPFLIGVMGPDAGQKIGLEFQSDGELVLASRGAACGASIRC